MKTLQLYHVKLHNATKPHIIYENQPECAEFLTKRRGNNREEALRMSRGWDCVREFKKKKCLLGDIIEEKVVKKQPMSGKGKL